MTKRLLHLKDILYSKDLYMRVLKIEDPAHIQLPEDVGERLAGVYGALQCKTS